MRLSGVIAGFFVLSSCSEIRPVRGFNPDGAAKSIEFDRARIAGTEAFRAGNYRKAVKEFGAGAAAAEKAGATLWLGRLRANQGGAYMMLGENRPAIRCLLAARVAAVKAEDLLTLQGVEGNLASVYVLTGNYEEAAAAAGRGAPLLPPKQTPEQRIRTLMTFGRAMAKARGVEAAAPMWRDALAMADARGSETLAADILELWGYELAEQGNARIVEAEEVLARAWRKRMLTRDDRLPLTEGKLARLYRKKGDTAAARMWMDRTLAALANGKRIPVPEWILRAEAAHITSDEGRLAAAMDGYRAALGMAEKWRRALPPAERLRLGAERLMEQELLDGYLRTAGKLYRTAPGAALAAEMFTLIQNTRAWSLDGSSAGSGADDALSAEARRLEGRWLAGDATAAADLQLVRAAILERDAAADNDIRSQAPDRLEAPAAGEAVLTYWLDDDGSWLWLWTKEGLRMSSLPPRAEILAAAESFRAAIAENRADAGSRGEQLMAALLGKLRQESLRAKRWDIVADDGLFHVPFGALPAGDGQYLTEKLELRLIPNARRQRPDRPAARRFLAVADPIFNSADERRAPEGLWRRVVHAASSAPELPRLPGTRQEAESAREVLRRAGFETAVHAGAESSEEAVLARLTEWEPGVVHFATHTATPANDAARPRLALSMRPDGSPGLLTAEDIAALPMRAELVVMSACRTTGGEGAGLLGLTRAWLTAGSRQVVATLWPVGDDSASFYSNFYGRLTSEGDRAPLAAASALRQAQLACLRGGGGHALPKYWAGHVLLARR